MEAKLQVSFARLLDAQGDHAASLERKRKALAAADELGDWHLHARIQVMLGASLYSLGRVPESIESYEGGIGVARRIGDRRMLAYGLWNAAGAYMKQNDLMRAEAYLKESESLFHKLREPVMEALVVQGFGMLWEKRGRWPMARQNLLAALDRMRGGGISGLELARYTTVAAHLFQRNGESEKALALLEEALVVARKVRAAPLIEEAQRYIAEYSAGSAPGGTTRAQRDALPAP